MEGAEGRAREIALRNKQAYDVGSKGVGQEDVDPGLPKESRRFSEEEGPAEGRRAGEGRTLRRAPTLRPQSVRGWAAKAGVGLRVGAAACARQPGQDGPPSETVG